MPPYKQRGREEATGAGGRGTADVTVGVTRAAFSQGVASGAVPDPRLCNVCLLTAYGALWTAAAHQPAATQRQRLVAMSCAAGKLWAAQRSGWWRTGTPVRSCGDRGTPSSQIAA